jgi:hypothetical protein
LSFTSPLSAFLFLASLTADCTPFAQNQLSTGIAVAMSMAPRSRALIMAIRLGDPFSEYHLLSGKSKKPAIIL